MIKPTPVYSLCTSTVDFEHLYISFILEMDRIRAECPIFVKTRSKVLVHSGLTYLQGSPAHQNSKHRNVFDLVGTAQ